jgi:hypothetical protein
VLALYTLFTTLILTVLVPLRWCSPRPALGTSLISTLSPALRIQLSLILSARSEQSPPSATRLLTTLVAAPLLALPIMLLSWTVGVFWLFALVVGIPGQRGRGDLEEGGLRVRVVAGDREQWRRRSDRERKDSEGRVAARWTRRLWEMGLAWGAS